MLNAIFHPFSFNFSLLRCALFLQSTLVPYIPKIVSLIAKEPVHYITKITSPAIVIMVSGGPWKVQTIMSYFNQWQSASN